MRVLVVFAIFAISTLVAVYITEAPVSSTSTTTFQCKDIVTSMQTSSIASLSFGLLGYWPLDEGSGTSACDLSGNDNTAILVGGPIWVNGKFGEALEQKTGDIGYASANVSGFSFPFTTSVWGNKTGDITNGLILTTVNSTIGTNSDQCSIEYLNGGISAGCWIDGHDNYITTNSTYNNSQFHLVTFTATSTTYTLYVDGVLRARGLFSNALSAQTHLDILDGFGRGSTNPGVEADDVRVYNRALTASEISELYSSRVTILETRNTSK
jgi:hypothetical protein